MGREEMLPLRGQFLELQLQTRPLEAREAVNEAALKRRSQISDGKHLKREPTTRGPLQVANFHLTV